MWILGSTFILTSAIIYLLFMLLWLNVITFVGSLKWFKILIALIALIGGTLNVRSFIKSKDTGCTVVDETKRKVFLLKSRKSQQRKVIFIYNRYYSFSCNS